MPDTLDGLASRMRHMEMAQVKTDALIENIKDDVHDIKEGNKDSAQKVDDRLSAISKLLWSAVALLFTSFIAALGILVSQGGIH